MTNWFEKYKPYLVNEAFIRDIDDEDDDSLDNDDELLSKSGKIVSMGGLKSHRHVLCFKVTGVSYSSRTLKKKLSEFQDVFMEYLEDVMFVTDYATNFVFDLGALTYAMKRDGITNDDIPTVTYDVDVDNNKSILVAGNKDDVDDIIDKFGSRHTYNKVYAYLSCDITRMNMQRLAKFINTMIMIFSRSVSESFGKATPNLIVYGNDFGNGINRAANEKIQNKVGGKDKLKAWAKQFMQFVDFHDINNYYNDNEISSRGISFLKQLHIKPIMKWVSEDENGVLTITVPRGSGKPLDLNLDYILSTHIPLNKLKLNVESTLNVQCNSYKALMLLKKIIVRCNYLSVYVQSGCDFSNNGVNGIIDFEDMPIDYIETKTVGEMKAEDKGKLPLIKCKNGRIATI